MSIEGQWLCTVQNGVAEAQFRSDLQRKREAWHRKGSARPRTAQEQQRCEVRGSGREEQYTARNRRGVDLRSKDGHRLRRRSALQRRGNELRHVAKAKYGSDLFSIGKVWKGAATARRCLAMAMRRSYRNREATDLYKGKEETENRA